MVRQKKIPKEPKKISKTSNKTPKQKQHLAAPKPFAVSSQLFPTICSLLLKPSTSTYLEPPQSSQVGKKTRRKKQPLPTPESIYTYDIKTGLVGIKVPAVLPETAILPPLPMFLDKKVLEERIYKKMSQMGMMEEITSDVTGMLSIAAEKNMKRIVEKLSVISGHRQEDIQVFMMFNVDDIILCFHMFLE